MVRSIGMDVHRTFAQIAVIEDGLCRDEGQIGVRPEDLRAWAATLDPEDEVALEATTNSDAIAASLGSLVARVVVSNPRKMRPKCSLLAVLLPSLDVLAQPEPDAAIA